MTIEDENPSDNLYTRLITTRLSYYSEDNYSFANGIVRTLHLEDLVPMDEISSLSAWAEAIRITITILTHLFHLMK